ncbi:MAG: uncharacterized protein conserved in archaea [Haloquadratum walsbyi J07HQW1]|jgi:Uncharacterized protein conserved in archaea|uniref:Dihydroneopterin aldolase n=1 Tax=Haloquadratum walsbyi J07HQW1 TaxID=1238424 RepID=U1ML43_9EURY|nr:MAG: uncharacterized protein conserved in archaea [Haloquadratum walsbyi J07HQW1]
MPAEDEPLQTTEATTAEEACFEAGIKFGTLYHQFAGTPVSPASASTLEDAIADAIENQPHCEAVTVTVRADRLETALAEQSAEYTELTGKFLDVTMQIEYNGCQVQTQMAMDGDYPLMEIIAIESPKTDPIE